uniref:hypothetical protein n=1 Tax=Psychrobacter sp. TaxID=56811 RepID=UPI001598D68F|nr:hypothetical protein [Psychrobacter sp.]QJS05171.1 hypothetical protein [Psychrobacter sp.]QJS05352.1 putative CorA-like domain [Psychrobacter sp.]QJS05433.1 hypothetical protein [Psychrobacter sp.]QJS05832.1 hypothetical protein [Psychrobacter sp.]
MSDQQLHDDIKNIVSALKGIIPLLQNMGETASDTIDKRLDNSLLSIDDKVGDLDNAIIKLTKLAESKERFILSAERQALNNLKQGVELLIRTDVDIEYSHQISQVIARLDPLIESKINDNIERLVEHKKLSISDHNDQVQAINDKLESSITEIEKSVFDSIDKLNAASAKIETISTAEVEKLKMITAAHSSALQSVENATDATANQMLDTLISVKRSAVFMSQSPATMSAITAAFFSLCLVASIVYINKLWLAMFISIIVIGALIAIVWGFVAWLDTKE